MQEKVRDGALLRCSVIASGSLPKREKTQENCGQALVPKNSRGLFQNSENRMLRWFHPSVVREAVRPLFEGLNELFGTRVAGD